jgi:hypothetical protein
MFGDAEIINSESGSHASPIKTEKIEKEILREALQSQNSKELTKQSFSPKAAHKLSIASEDDMELEITKQQTTPPS